MQHAISHILCKARRTRLSPQGTYSLDAQTMDILD